MSSLKDMQNSARAAVEKDSSDDPSTPQRGGLDRTKSGGSRMAARRPPGRSKSHKIGRPNFSTEEMPPEPERGVNRAKSGRQRAVPNRTGSFGRAAPDRGASTGALRAHRRQQMSGMHAEPGDDVSISDSVFTSASNQTQDSIALRKQQFSPGDVAPGGMRMPSRSVDTTEFDDQSLLTVDSIPVHHRHVDAAGNATEGDMSVFSESFVSEGTYGDDFSDYDDEDGVNLQEVEYEFEEGLSLDDKEAAEETEATDEDGEKE